ncbi:ComC/BlpC family leader-containing pheromone/bacteriocin [Streptococcus cuniculipharyngis]
MDNFSELSASELNHISGGNWWTIFLNKLAFDARRN